MSTEVEFIENDITDLAVANGGGALSDTGLDNVLFMADRADKYIAALNKIMDAAIKITCEHDWVLIGGKPYLQESGATKVARLFGISIETLGKPVREVDSKGYVTYTYKMRLHLKEQFIDCEGSRSMRQDFFSKAGKDKPKKKPDEIIERDVKMAAYTNCVNNGIKRLIPGLRNIDVSVLEKAGFNMQKISGYTFKTGSKGGNTVTQNEPDSELACSHCGKAVSQKVASYSQSKFGEILCMDCQKEMQQ